MKATLRLGYISTTGDAEGDISVAEGISCHDLTDMEPQVEMVLKSFTGLIAQIPPMYSAVTCGLMYIYARRWRSTAIK